jgi:dimethylargininase
MNSCELTHLERVEIDVERAAAQHAVYVDRLRGLAFDVVTLPAEPALPDSVFVEDPVVAVEELAVMTRMGAESRRPESPSLAAALAPFRRLEWMTAPATLEGGDVVRIGHTVYAGISQRTNREGIAQLAAFLAPYGYDVRPVDVRGCLHLKSGACYIGNGLVLANREWVDTAAFEGCRIVDVAEPWASDVLAVDDAILMPAGFPLTERVLGNEGFDVQTVDVSELQKAEAGVTCLSVILE